MPPSSGTSQSVATLGNAPRPRTELNTIFFPSGVHPTTVSFAVCHVSCFGRPPSAATTYTS